MTHFARKAAIGAHPGTKTPRSGRGTRSSPPLPPLHVRTLTPNAFRTERVVSATGRRSAAGYDARDMRRVIVRSFCRRVRPRGDCGRDCLGKRSSASPSRKAIKKRIGEISRAFQALSRRSAVEAIRDDAPGRPRRKTDMRAGQVLRTQGGGVAGAPPPPAHHGQRHARGVPGPVQVHDEDIRGDRARPTLRTLGQVRGQDRAGVVRLSGKRWRDSRVTLSPDVPGPALPGHDRLRCCPAWSEPIALSRCIPTGSS